MSRQVLAFIRAGTFKTFCKAIGSPDMPVIDDLVRYQKIAAIVFTFLQVILAIH